jgi:hypothetical protein
MNILLGGDPTDGDMWFGLFVLFLILTIVFVVLYMQNNNNQKYLALFIATIILAIASWTNIEPDNKTPGSGTTTSESQTRSFEFSP